MVSRRDLFGKTALLAHFVASSASSFLDESAIDSTIVWPCDEPVWPAAFIIQSFCSEDGRLGLPCAFAWKRNLVCAPYAAPRHAGTRRESFYRVRALQDLLWPLSWSQPKRNDLHIQRIHCENMWTTKRHTKIVCTTGKAQLLNHRIEGVLY